MLLLGYAAPAKLPTLPTPTGYVSSTVMPSLLLTARLAIVMPPAPNATQDTLLSHKVVSVWLIVVMLTVIIAKLILLSARLAKKVMISTIMAPAQNHSASSNTVPPVPLSIPVPPVSLALP